MNIRQDDLSGEQTRALLRLHLQGMHANSPPGQVFALDLSGLQRADVTVWTAWDNDRVCGVGALRRLDAATGEVKSMRTHPDYLRRGVGRLLLAQIIATARARGMRRLCLETGQGPAFVPALAMYQQHGFVAGPPFGDYAPSDFNQFFQLDLG